MSMRPKAATQASTMALTEALLVTSLSCARTVPPNSSMRATVSLIESPFLSAANTLAPSRANSTAVARPLPQPGPTQPAPVTSATLSFSRAAILLRTLQAELLDQRAPFALLGLDIGLGLGDRWRRNRNKADVGGLLLHVRIGHDLLHLPVKPVDDIL